MMIPSDLCHQHCHLDSFVTRHPGDYWIERRLVDRTEPQLFISVHSDSRLGSYASAPNWILISMVMGQIPDRLNACVSCCNEASERVVSGDEAVADREKSVVANNLQMIGQPVIRRVPGRDQEIMTTSMDEAALEACHDVASEESGKPERERELSSQVHRLSIPRPRRTS